MRHEKTILVIHMIDNSPNSGEGTNPLYIPMADKWCNILPAKNISVILECPNLI